MTRKGGKYETAEHDILSIFDSEPKKFKNRMQDKPADTKPSKKERVNPPYMFGMSFVEPEDADKHVHSKYTAICKTDCHFITVDRRHLH